MLNPDGVIYGNYRWSLLGFDLNRRWSEPSKIYDPTIFYTKKLISVFKEERDIQLYTDIHGHSRKRNAFMYGWEYEKFEYDSRAKNALIRLFPALMEKKNQIFSFKDWSFKWEKAKEETGRIVCFKEIGIRHSFTLESTFYGREEAEDDPEGWDLHMHIKDFKEIGEDLAKWFINFIPIPKYKRKINFLYMKFLKIIHDEALKWCLPFNQERYLKRNYRNDAPGIDIPNSNIDDLDPSLDELEGKTIEPESYNENMSNYSSDGEAEKPCTFIDTTSKVNAIKNEIQNQGNENLEDINFEEFDQVLDWVKQYEQHKAQNKSNNSYCDDSDSDDVEDNLIQNTMK